MDDNSKYTCIETDNMSSCYTFTWKIRNFSFSNLSFNKSVSSEKFSAFKDIFHLTAGYSYDIKGGATFYVQLHRIGSQTTIGSKISLVNHENVNVYVRSFQIMPPALCSNKLLLIKAWEFSTKKQELLTGDCLTLVCQLVAIGMEKTPVAQGGEEGKDVLIRDIGSLLTSGINSDVDIQVEGQTIKAHSQILSARSSVFSAMFGHDMKERQSGIVNITDLKAATIQSLLQYIYTGGTPNIKDMSPDLLMELYVAADKYCIPDLKITCSQTIIDSMTKENAKRYTVLAIQYDDQMIMDEAVSFLAKTIKIKS